MNKSLLSLSSERGQWTKVKLGSIAFEHKERAGSTVLPVLSVTKYDGIVMSLEYFKKQVFSRNTGDYKVLRKGQFAYATIHLDEGSIGLLKDIDAGIVSPMYTVFGVDESKVDREFLLYLLKSDLYIRKYQRIGQGSINRRKSIGFRTLGDLIIDLPPLHEQRCIAEILSTVDDAIAKTEQIITKSETVKKGLMQQLLTKGIGYTRFKKTEIGEIPNGWNSVFLKDVIGQLSAGVSVNAENRAKEDDEFGVLKVSSVSQGVFNPKEHKAILADETSRAAVSPRHDHIIVSRANTVELVGASSYIENDHPDLFLSDKLWQISTKDSSIISSRWLSYVLASPKMRSMISAKATGSSSSMKNISKSSFLNLKVALPPLEEQKEIEKILKSVEDKIRKELKINNKLKTIKQGLMQQLLTGKTRVPEVTL